MASEGKNTPNIDAQGEEIDAPGEPNPYAYLYHQPASPTLMPLLNHELEILADPLGIPDADIILVPGCMNTYEEWTHMDPSSDAFWPRSILPTRFPTSRIMIHTDRGFQRNEDPWKGLAESIYAVRMTCPDRPIILVVDAAGYHTLKECIRTSYKNPYYQKPICDAIQGIIFIRIPESGDPTTDLFKIPGFEMPKHDNKKLNLSALWRETTERLSWMRKSHTDAIDDYRFSLRQPVEKWYMMLRVQGVFPELTPFIWQCPKLQAIDVLECLWITHDESKMPLWMELKSINVFIRPVLQPVKASEDNDLTSKRISGDPFDKGLNQLSLAISGYLNKIKEAKARQLPLQPTKVNVKSHVQT